jgi:phosphomannomutase
MSIFKAYDIRGKYPSELDENKAYLIGRAVVQFLKVNPIGTLLYSGKVKFGVGRDVRVSSDSIFASLAKGIIDEGASVTDLGVLTTPMSYFASGFYKFPATIMVTASHNPPEYNGFKICRENAIALSENTGLKEIERIVNELTSSRVNEFKGLSVPRLDVLPEYKKFILSLLNDVKPFKIVVDTANGSVGPVFDDIIKDTPIKYVPLYFQPDGRFPNHEPNPMDDANLKDIKAAIIKEKADFGVAFDGDGDRCIFLDENAQRIPSDLITALLGREIINNEPKATIVYDLRSSWVAREEIDKAGGISLRERVGHAFIKSTMRKHNSPFGGELSGHYYFRENYFADSAMVAFVHFINAVSLFNMRVSEIIKPLQRYFASGELNFKVNDKDAVIKEVSKRFKDGKQDSLDGITIEYPDYWFNIRPSNTEPLLRLNIEARTSAQLDKIKKELVSIIR